jgi:hypothetical protein
MGLIHKDLTAKVMIAQFRMQDTLDSARTAMNFSLN